MIDDLQDLGDGVDALRGFEMHKGFPGAPQAHKQLSKVAVRLHEGRVQAQRGLVLGDRVKLAAGSFCESPAEVKMRVYVIGPGAQGCLEVDRKSTRLNS